MGEQAGVVFKIIIYGKQEQEVLWGFRMSHGARVHNKNIKIITPGKVVVCARDK